MQLGHTASMSSVSDIFFLEDAGFFGTLKKVIALRLHEQILHDPHCVFDYFGPLHNLNCLLSPVGFSCFFLGFGLLFDCVQSCHVQ